jgi:glucose-6-phosphate 1-dehydrogenase
VYLSISPDLYPSVAKAVAEHLRPSTEGAWLRVVFEKPFGRVRVRLCHCGGDRLVRQRYGAS